MEWKHEVEDKGYYFQHTWIKDQRSKHTLEMERLSRMMHMELMKSKRK